MPEDAQFDLNEVLGPFSDFREGMLADTFGLEMFLQARVKRIGANGWLSLNADEEAEGVIKDDVVSKVTENAIGDLVRFVDDAWSTGRISVIRAEDDPSLDAKLYAPIRAAAYPPFDGSQYTTNNIFMKAAVLSSQTGENDFVAYGGAGTRIHVRKKFFHFDEREKLVTMPVLPILQIGDEWAFIRYQDCYYIFDEKRFEQISGVSDMVVRRAKAAITALLEVDGVSFRNLDDVFSALQNTEFARKLAAAHSQGVFENLNPQGLATDIQTNELELRHQIDGDNIILEPDLSSREKRRDFVDLLVESLFVSRRGQKYRALQKLPRG